MWFDRFEECRAEISVQILILAGQRGTNVADQSFISVFKDAQSFRPGLDTGSFSDRNGVIVKNVKRCASNRHNFACSIDNPRFDFECRLLGRGSRGTAISGFRVSPSAVGAKYDCLTVRSGPFHFSDFWGWTPLPDDVTQCHKQTDH